MKKSVSATLLIATTSLFSGCVNEVQIEEKVKKVLAENPSVLTEAIKKNPVVFMDALQSAAKVAQSEMAKKREQEEQKKLEASFDNPMVPNIRSDENFRGPKDAPLTLVEYSDFECPYCARAHDTVLELMKEFGGKIRFVYKHVPLDFHANALITAKQYEAIRLQSGEKAWQFHDEVLKQQKKLRQGEGFLKVVAKKLGVNMSKLAKDIKSDVVMKRIQEDQAEAAKFGFQGTPGFLLNGIPVKGAYPKSHFMDLVEELKKRNKVTL